MTVPTTVPRIAYTNKDYAQMRQELINRIPIVSGGAWTDINESDPGTTIVELFTAMIDSLLFYLDQSVNEAQFITAVQRRSVRNLAALIDYFPPSVASAVGTVQFSGHTFGLNEHIVLPPYTRVGTAQSGGVEFRTTTDINATDPSPIEITLDINNPTPIVRIVQGSKKEDEFDSDNTPNQRYRLTATSIDSTTVLVKVNDIRWVGESSFVAADMNTETYVTSLDDKGNVYITFGDGTFGKIPHGKIHVDYIVSEGEAGRVGAHKINKILDTLTVVITSPPSSHPATDLAVDNSEQTTAGLSPESIERTKLLAPASLAALFTAKAKSDYNALVLRSDQAITKVNTWGEQEESPPNYNMLNKVQITFTGRDSYNHLFQPNTLEYDTVKANVLDYLNALNRKIITTRNVIIDPVYVHVRVTGVIYVDLSTLDGDAVLSAVKTALTGEDVGAFRFDVMNFGRDLYPSQIQRVIDSVVGVSWSKLSPLTAVPSLTVIPTIPPTTQSRYITGGGLLMRKNEVVILEDSTVTGLTLPVGFTEPHLNFTVEDAKDLPVPDALGL